MKLKILVVDDDTSISEFVSVALSTEPNFEVRTAEDGREGLEVAAEYKPDLVILDLMMPRMHGYEVCQHLRADKTQNAGLKILITSSKSYLADIEQALQAGADAYLIKPYNLKDLMKSVKKLLNMNGADESCPAVDASDPRFTPRARTRLPETGPLRAKTGAGPVSVRFWGTRGSSPAPGPKTMRYGGNTSCTELRMGDQIFFIDSGTGIRELGIALQEEFKDKPIHAKVFVGHTHWDHIQGFPFFTPLYGPQNSFTVYSVRAAGKSLEKVFRGQMAADYFPVPLQSLASALHFVELEGPLEFGPVKVSYHFLNHPGVAIGFRFDSPGGSVTYISDHEPFARLHGESASTERQDHGIVEFARDTDLLICEAQYTEQEYLVKKGWGHSTFDDAVDRAIAANAKQLAIFHHDPTHTDEMMDRYVAYCLERIKNANSGLKCFAAQEGQSVPV
ncbi:MAG TPA: response regulator [Elusimicrobiota bacterium]|nr:response regulator [Elusimicrobiota bacterium]